MQKAHLLRCASIDSLQRTAQIRLRSSTTRAPRIWEFLIDLKTSRIRKRGDSSHVDQGGKRTLNPSRTRNASGRNAAPLLASDCVYQRTEGKAAAQTDFGRRSRAVSRRTEPAGIAGASLFASRHFVGIRPSRGWGVTLLLPWLALRRRRASPGNAW